MKIILDIDDLLSDTFRELERREGPAATYAVEDLRVMFPDADLKAYFTSVDFHLALPVVDGAAYGVQQIVRSGHEAMYLSARQPAVEQATEDWFEQAGFPRLPLFCVGRDEKLKMLASEPYDLLIDDQMRYLSVARDRGKATLALNQPWNARWEGPKAANWDEIVDAIG